MPDDAVFSELVEFRATGIDVIEQRLAELAELTQRASQRQTDLVALYRDPTYRRHADDLARVTGRTRELEAAESARQRLAVRQRSLADGSFVGNVQRRLQEREAEHKQDLAERQRLTGGSGAMYLGMARREQRMRLQAERQARAESRLELRAQQMERPTDADYTDAQQLDRERRAADRDHRLRQLQARRDDFGSAAGQADSQSAHEAAQQFAAQERAERRRAESLQRGTRSAQLADGTFARQHGEDQQDAREDATLRRQEQLVELQARAQAVQSGDFAQAAREQMALSREQRRVAEMERYAGRDAELRAQFGDRLGGAAFRAERLAQSQAGRAASGLATAAVATGGGLAMRGFSGTVEMEQFNTQVTRVSREMAASLKPALELATKYVGKFADFLGSLSPSGQKALGTLLAGGMALGAANGAMRMATGQGLVGAGISVAGAVRDRWGGRAANLATDAAAQAAAQVAQQRLQQQATSSAGSVAASVGGTAVVGAAVQRAGFLGRLGGGLARGGAQLARFGRFGPLGLGLAAVAAIGGITPSQVDEDPLAGLDDRTRRLSADDHRRAAEIARKDRSFGEIAMDNGVGSIARSVYDIGAFASNKLFGTNYRRDATLGMSAAAMHEHYAGVKDEQKQKNHLAQAGFDGAGSTYQRLSEAMTMKDASDAYRGVVGAEGTGAKLGGTAELTEIQRQQLMVLRLIERNARRDAAPEPPPVGRS